MCTITECCQVVHLCEVVAIKKKKHRHCTSFTTEIYRAQSEGDIATAIRDTCIHLQEKN